MEINDDLGVFVCDDDRDENEGEVMDGGNNGVDDEGEAFAFDLNGAGRRMEF